MKNGKDEKGIVGYCRVYHFDCFKRPLDKIHLWQTQSFEVLFNVNSCCFTTASAFFGIFSHRKDGFPHHSVGGFSLGLLGKLAQTAVVKLHPGVLVGIVPGPVKSNGI